MENQSSENYIYNTAAQRLKDALAVVRENNRRLMTVEKRREDKENQKSQQMSPSDAMDAYNKYKQFSGSGGTGAGQFQGTQVASGQGMQSGGAMTAGGHAGTGVAQTSAFAGEAAASGSGVMGGGAQTAAGVSGQGSAGAGAAGGGMGSAALVGGAIAAAILAQHQMSNETDTKIKMEDGSEVETDDAFSGHYGTEPWLAFASDKLGTTPTRGEKFDAAMENGGGKEGWESAPGAIGYWANPSGEWMEKGGEAIIGNDKYNKYINPAGKLEDEIGRVFGKWFG